MTKQANFHSSTNTPTQKQTNKQSLSNTQSSTLKPTSTTKQANLYSSTSTPSQSITQEETSKQSIPTLHTVTHSNPYIHTPNPTSISKQANTPTQTITQSTTQKQTNKQTEAITKTQASKHKQTNTSKASKHKKTHKSKHKQTNTLTSIFTSNQPSARVIKSTDSTPNLSSIFNTQQSFTKNQPSIPSLTQEIIATPSPTVRSRFTSSSITRPSVTQPSLSHTSISNTFSFTRLMNSKLQTPILEGNKVATTTATTTETTTTTKAFPVLNNSTENSSLEQFKKTLISVAFLGGVFVTVLFLIIFACTKSHCRRTSVAPSNDNNNNDNIAINIYDSNHYLQPQQAPIYQNTQFIDSPYQWDRESPVKSELNVSVFNK